MDDKYIFDLYYNIGGLQLGIDLKYFRQAISKNPEYNKRIYNHIGGEKSGISYESFATSTGISEYLEKKNPKKKENPNMGSPSTSEKKKSLSGSSVEKNSISASYTNEEYKKLVGSTKPGIFPKNETYYKGPNPTQAVAKLASHQTTTEQNNELKKKLAFPRVNPANGKPYTIIEEAINEPAQNTSIGNVYTKEAAPLLERFENKSDKRIGIFFTKQDDKDKLTSDKIYENIDRDDFAKWLVTSGEVEKFNSQSEYFGKANSFNSQKKQYELINRYISQKNDDLFKDNAILSARLKIEEQNGGISPGTLKEYQDNQQEIEKVTQKNLKLINQFTEVKKEKEERDTQEQEREKARIKIKEGKSSIKDYLILSTDALTDTYNKSKSALINGFAGAARILSTVKKIDGQNSNIWDEVADQLVNTLDASLTINNNQNQFKYKENKVKYNNKTYTVRDDGYIFDSSGNIVKNDTELANQLRSITPSVTESRYDVGGGVSSVGEQIAQMGAAIFAGGGTAIGTGASYFVMSFDQNYREAKEAGFSDNEARLYSTTVSGLDGIMSQLVPDIKIAGLNPLGGKVLLNQIIKQGISSQSIKKAVAKAGGNYIKNIVGEVAEEVSTDVAQNAIQRIANTLKNKELFNTDYTAEDALDTSILTTLTTALVGVGQVKRDYKLFSNTDINKAKLYAAYTPEIVTELDKIKKDEQFKLKTGITDKDIDHLTTEINTLKQITQSFPKNLSPSQYVDIVPLYQQREDLENQKKNLDPAFTNNKEDLEGKIKKINEEINTIASSSPQTYKKDKETTTTDLNNNNTIPQQSTEIEEKKAEITPPLTEKEIPPAEIPLQPEEQRPDTSTETIQKIEKIKENITNGKTTIKEQIENAQMNLKDYSEVYGKDSIEEKKEKELIKELVKLEEELNKGFKSENGKYIVSLSNNRLQLKTPHGETVTDLSDASKNKYYIEAIKNGIYKNTPLISDEILQNAQNEEQINTIIAKESVNPSEIAQALNHTPKYENEEEKVDYKTSAIADMMVKRKIKPDSFYRFNDRNNVTKGLAKTYFSKEGHSLDTLSREISEIYYGDTRSITPEEIAKFMTEYPTGWKKTINPQYENLINRFVEISGLHPTPKILDAFQQKNEETINEKETANHNNKEDKQLTKEELEQLEHQDIDETLDNYLPFQSKTKRLTPISQQKFNQLITGLKKTGLAKNVITDSSSYTEKLNKIAEKDKMRTHSGNVYGFIDDGTVYLDRTKINANTPIHEFGHLWNQYIKKSNPELYQKGTELIKKSPYWEQVNENPAYANLSEENKADEAIATAIGDKGEIKINQQYLKSTIKDWINKAWNWIADKFGIHTQDLPIQNLTLDKFIDYSVEKITSGKEITTTVNKNPTDIQFQIEKEQKNLSDLINEEEYKVKEVKKSVETIKKTNAEIRKFIKDKIINGLKSNAGLPTHVAEIARYLQREYNVINDSLNFELKEIHQTIEKDIVKGSKGTDQQKKTQIAAKKRLVNQYLAGENVEISFLTEDSVKILNGLRARIDNLSMDIIDLLNNQIAQKEEKLKNYKAGSTAYTSINNSIEKEKQLIQTIQDNKTKYLHRTYEIFINPNYVKEQKFYDNKDRLYANNPLIKKAAEYLEKESGLTKIEALRYLDELLRNSKQNTAFNYIAAQGNIHTNIFKKRKDIPLPIRTLLGEIQDPVLNYGNTIYNMSTYLAEVAYQDNLREALLNSRLATLEKKVGYYEYKPNSPGWSGLQNIYVPLWVKESLDGYNFGTQSKNLIWRTLSQLGATVKYNKTVLSVTTTSRNIISGAFLALNAGYIFTSKPGKIPEYFKIAFNYSSTKGEYRQMLIREGIIKDGTSFGELQDLKRKYSQSINLQKGNSLAINKQIAEFAQKVYAFGDDFYKIAAFEIETDRLVKHGIPREKAYKMASERIRNTMPTYSYVPKLVKTIGRSGLVGSFISFPFEVVRTNINNIKYIQKDWQEGRKDMALQRGLGMITSMTISSLLATFSRALLGLSDEDDDSIKDVLAEWQTNSALVYLNKDSGGAPTFIDVSAFFPDEVIIKPIRALIDGRESRDMGDRLIESAKEWLDPYFGIDITADALNEFLNNQSDWGGKIYRGDNFTDLFTDKNGKSEYLDLADWINRKLAPGSYNNLREFALANVDYIRDKAKTNPFFKPLKYVTDDLLEMGSSSSKSGRIYKNSDALLAVFGFRTSTVNIGISLKYKSLKAEEELREIKSSLIKKISINKEYTASEMTQMIEDAQEKQNKIYKSEYKIINTTRRLGVTDDLLMDVLNHGTSDNIRLLKGYIPQIGEKTKQNKSGALLTSRAIKKNIKNLKLKYMNNPEKGAEYINNYQKNAILANKITRKLYKKVKIEE